MSIRKPTLRKPKVSKIKKPLTSKRKRVVKKLPTMKTRINICNEHHVQSTIQIVIGSAAEEILKVINEKNVNLVVIAKRRKLKGMRKLLSLGSVSRKIVENTSCPVLLIDVEN